jgi:L-serine/L-threonine ammonia-lyase
LGDFCADAIQSGGQTVIAYINATILSPCSLATYVSTVPLAAMETHGSNCFYHSILANRFDEEHPHSARDGATRFRDESNQLTLASIPAIKSRAASLGATSPAGGVVRLALDRSTPVVCVSVPDELSMQAALGFAGESSLKTFITMVTIELLPLDDHQMLAELACATTLVPAYFPGLFNQIFPPRNSSSPERTAVFIVCGGVKTSVEEVMGYKQHLASSPTSYSVWVDGDSHDVDLRDERVR